MKLKKTLAVMLIALTVSPPCWADTMWTKLGRGMGNAAFGWLEILHQPINMGKQERWPFAIFGGVPKGIVYAVGRTLVGVYEVVTFPVPLPSGYHAMMEPEFIIPRAE